jgi:hypothetical protein
MLPIDHFALADRALADRADAGREGGDSELDDPQTWDGPPPDSWAPPSSAPKATRKRTRDSGARILLGLSPNPHQVGRPQYGGGYSGSQGPEQK